MAYIVKQYRHPLGEDTDNDFIEQVGDDWQARGIVVARDSGILPSGVNPFEEACCYGSNSTLTIDQPYYCLCQIERLNSNQQIYIKACKATEDSENNLIIEGTPQYIKTIVIQQKTDEKQYATVDFIFKPIMEDINCIIFELQRNSDDYYNSGSNPRKVRIAYQELGEIKNILTENRILKIGVQSRPFLTMCINGEEIHTSRTGVYEINYGVVPINSFSVVGVSETPAGIEGWKNSDPPLPSTVFFGDRTTIIDGFTLDYMYNG